MLAASGCLWWAKRQLRASGAVVPLTFHRVLRDFELRQTHSLAGIVLTEATFRELVAHVAQECEPVDLRGSAPGKASPRLKVAFTFDDGWLDTYTVAFPIARELGIPFTVFICPELLDRSMPFWPEQLIALVRNTQPLAQAQEIETLIERLKTATPGDREQYLATLSEIAQKDGRQLEGAAIDRTVSWAAIYDMAKHGVAFGSHTQTHPILTGVTPVTARQEVCASKSAIETALQGSCDTFAYPNGDHSSKTRGILAQAGYKLAVTTTRGAWTASTDRLAIPRSNICEENVVGPTGRFSVSMFEYNTFWKAWRASKAHSRLKPQAHEQPAPVNA
jgi:peptidoglycan/xylan/chitin deacetylase (PgdA/CDA1 family)